MKVRALKHCDVTINGITTALFAGQDYDLPRSEAEALIKGDHVKSLATGPPRTKAVEGPPEDKGRRRRK